MVQVHKTPIKSQKIKSIQVVHKHVCTFNIKVNIISRLNYCNKVYTLLAHEIKEGQKD